MQFCPSYLSELVQDSVPHAATRWAKSRYIISTLISFVPRGVGLNTTTKIASFSETLASVELSVKAEKITIL